MLGRGRTPVSVTEDEEQADERTRLIPSSEAINASSRHHTYTENGGENSQSETESESESESVSSRTDSADFTRPPSIWRTPRRSKLVLWSLALNDFSAMMSVGVMAPIFPLEASHQGVSNTVSGWIFGVFSLVQVLTSPLFGKLLPHTGTKFMYFAGQFMAAGCTILFGFLAFVPSDEDDNTVFLVLCFLLRIFNSLGVTAALTASFSMTVEFFPDNVGQAFGLLEFASGIGLMAGRGLSGPLYQLNKFMLPFVGIGAIMMALIPVHLCLLPSGHEIVGLAVVQESSSSESQGLTRLRMRDLLRIPSVIVVGLAIVYGALLWSILDPTLEPHLRVFQLPQTVLGLIFVLTSACYALFSPLWGWAADNIYDSSPLLIAGFLGSALGMFLLGPSPLLGFKTHTNCTDVTTPRVNVVTVAPSVTGECKLWLNIVALVVVGLSVSLATVPTFDKIVDVAEKAGMEDTLAMYGLVAGLWGSFFALGEFLGPSIGGWLMDTIGFEWCMTIAGLGSILMAIVLLALWIYERKMRKIYRFFVGDKDSESSSSEESSVSETENVEAQYSAAIVHPSILPGNFEDSVGSAVWVEPEFSETSRQFQRL